MMPKLTKNSLEKRFHCPHCEKTFRGRQGLSGHIQFKHAINSSQTFSDKSKKLKERSDSWQHIVEQINLPDDIGKLGEEIFQRWMDLLIYFDSISIELNDNDFKNFFIQNFRIDKSGPSDETLLALKALELLKPNG